VSATMLMTSALLLIAMREIWQWSLPLSIGVAGFFLIVDSAFFISNTLKIVDGGYVPLLLAGGIYLLMYIWHRGAGAVSAYLHENLTPFDTFLAELERNHIPRVPGTAVFLTRAVRDTPPVMTWHVRHNRALQQHVLAVTAQIQPVPWIAESERVNVSPMGPGFWRVVARYGFMERPNIPKLLSELPPHGCTIDLADVTYFVGHETLTRRTDGRGLPHWQEALFATMERNAAHVTDFFSLPSDQVVEIGRLIAI
jgi:KUP system potassium uptake protein